ncbi:hypothetical protein GYA13_02135 [Candidatus Kuenenbacteria bacterium]|nr:hypothetical protein [Candidatus Kuenenbacteria bacterium]
MNIIGSNPQCPCFQLGAEDINKQLPAKILRFMPEGTKSVILDISAFNRLSEAFVPVLLAVKKGIEDVGVEFRLSNVSTKAEIISALSAAKLLM